MLQLSLNSPPAIELKSISRYYFSAGEKVFVLKNISLTISQGEMIAIVGSSGSGKSTLMNIIGCLDKPSEGELRINGATASNVDSTQLAEIRSDNIGFIFQRYHLISYLSAQENVIVPALYADGNSKTREERAKKLLGKLGMSDRAFYKPGQLSGGQQQRVSIARALMNDARIILADEPTGALDSTNAKLLMQELRILHQAGYTVVIVTHDHKIAEYADRIVEISNGEIVSDPVHSPNSSQLKIPDTNIYTNIKHSTSHFLKQPRYIADALNIAWRSLKGHRVRAFLSMLGIIIGIAAVVLSITIGEGTKKSVLEEVNKLGNNVVAIYNADSAMSGETYESSLNIRDVELLKRYPYIKYISPVVQSFAKLIKNNRHITASIQGVDYEYFQAHQISAINGRLFSYQDVIDSAAVAVIDDVIAIKLFGSANMAIGQTLIVNETPFVVVGVVAQTSPSSNANTNDVWTPYSSYITRLTGQVPLSRIDFLLEDNVKLENIRRYLESDLLKSHGSKNFSFSSNTQFYESAYKTSNTLSLLVTAVASISLLVGGIGIMNIMLASVAERTYEIGIRLAVGARPRDIQFQFLVEALFICVIGGVLGIAFALVIILVCLFFSLPVPVSPSWHAFTVSFMFMILIGLIFGYFPARRASKLHPTEALLRE